MMDSFKGMMGNFQMIQKAMTDPNFRKLAMHPKFQELIKDSDFQEALRTNNVQKIAASSKFMDLMKDPEMAQLMAKVNFRDIIGPKK